MSYGSCSPVMGSMLLCSGISPEKHDASLPLFHQPRAVEAPQKSMLLCPSSISTAQRRLPNPHRKAYISAPLPSALRSGDSPEKHTSMLLFHQHRAAEAPQKSMLLCSSSISTAQRRLPSKSMLLCLSSISTAQRRLPRKAYISAPLPSAPRSGGSPEKHASLSLLHHQPRAAPEALQKSIHLCPSSISTAQRKLPRKAHISAPLPSAPRSGSSPEKHTSLSLFHLHRAAQAPQKACFSAPLPSAPRSSGGSPEKHTSRPLFHQHRAAEAPQKSTHLCSSSISTAHSRSGSSPEKHLFTRHVPTLTLGKFPFQSSRGSHHHFPHNLNQTPLP